MDQYMALQVASLGVRFTTVLADMCLLLTMDQFMPHQGAILSGGLTTKIADMFPLKNVATLVKGICEMGSPEL